MPSNLEKLPEDPFVGGLIRISNGSLAKLSSKFVSFEPSSGLVGFGWLNVADIFGRLSGADHGHHTGSSIDAFDEQQQHEHREPSPYWSAGETLGISS